ncbi:MAG: hypothetical protein RR744_00225 [Cellulosilyticaceae bacterium]
MKLDKGYEFITIEEIIKNTKEGDIIAECTCGEIHGIYKNIHSIIDSYSITDMNLFNAKINRYEDKDDEDFGFSFRYEYNDFTIITPV